MMFRRYIELAALGLVLVWAAICTFQQLISFIDANKVWFAIGFVVIGVGMFLYKRWRVW